MSKEKQIDDIAGVICGMKNGCNGCMFNSDTCYERKGAEEIYNTGYRKQEWVSVKERLPDLDLNGKGRYGGQRSVRVLCACKQKGGKIFVKYGYYEPRRNGRVYWRIPGSIDTVTHWMPLPEPPKGE